MTMFINCPCCQQWHEIKRVSDSNWYGDHADTGEVFVTSWCSESGREVGDWLSSESISAYEMRAK